jgi:hypothetical protein
MERDAGVFAQLTLFALGGAVVLPARNPIASA